jgi:hypothetical protein
MDSSPPLEPPPGTAAFISKAATPHLSQTSLMGFFARYVP